MTLYNQIVNRYCKINETFMNKKIIEIGYITLDFLNVYMYN